MPRPPRKAFEAAKYHITVRGNARQRIFRRDEDRCRFLEQLRSGIEKDGVILYAYVLMSNHYHLLIETRRANISAFMQRLNTAYAMYFRYKHKRPGHLLQGRYGAKLVAGDEYVLRLTRYMHLNPVKIKEMEDVPEAEKIKYLRSYPWSSYRGYIDGQKMEPDLDYRCRKLIGGRSLKEERRRYRKYVESFISDDDTELMGILGASEYAIGDDEYVASIENLLRSEKKSGRMAHDVKWPKERKISLESVSKVVAAEFGCGADALRKHGRTAGAAKSVAIEIACRMTGQSQRKVAAYFGGISGAGVSYQRRRLKERRMRDKSLDEVFNRLIKGLGNEQDPRF